MLDVLRRPPVALLILGVIIVPFAITLNFWRTEGGDAPYADQWCNAVPMVIDAADGNLTPGRVFKQHNAHRVVTDNITNLLGFYFGNWNVKNLTLVNFALGVINFGVLFWVLRTRDQLDGALLVLGAFLLSALIFYVRARAIWMWNFSLPYIITFTLPLVALAILGTNKPGWWPFSIALLLNVVSAYSLSSGLISVALFPFILYLLGYRKWSYYVVWAGVLALTVYGFFYNYNRTQPNFCDGYGIDLYSDVAFTLQDRLIRLPHYVFRTIPAALMIDFNRDYGRTLWVGLWLVLALGFNGVYMAREWWRRREGFAAAVWFYMVVFSLGSVSMIGVGRVSRELTEIIFASNYAYQSIMVILGIAGLALTATAAIQRKTTHTWVDSGLLTFNALSLAIFGFLYLNVAGRALDVSQYPHNVRTNLYPYYYGEQCMQDYFFDGRYEAPDEDDMSCYLTLTLFGGSNATFEEYRYYMRRLAELRLTGFADLTFDLPNEYTTGEPVVVDTDIAAQQLRVVDINGREINETDIARVVSSEDEFEALRKVGAQHVFVDEAPLESAFWYFGMDNDPNNHAYIWHPRYGYYFLLVRRPYQLTPMYLGAEIRAERDQQPDVVFGDEVRMIDWQLEDSIEVAACDTVTVRSWWEPEADDEALLTDYTLSLVALDADGDAVAQVDDTLTPYMGTAAWENDTTYYDTRTVTIPCDTPAGEYPLIQSVYFYLDADQPLVAANDDGAELGTWAYLTTLQVSESE
jgi:hypothetical protein